VTTPSVASALLAALQQLLTNEHAAVYGYGIVGAHLIRAEETSASAAFAAHENRRDAIIRLLRDNGAEPVAALPAYRPRAAVVDRRTAVLLAIALEEDCAAACTPVLSATSDATIRRTAISWLTDMAVRDQLWRATLGPTSIATTPPLPGLKAPPPAPSPSASPGGPA
jgi:hypothetical protein